MCIGFGGLATIETKLYFSEPDRQGDCSHGTTLVRLNWTDTLNPFNRPFVRWQFTGWTPESFEFDEEDTLPGWAEENRREIENKCVALLNKVLPLWEANISSRQDSWKKYKHIQKTAREKYDCMVKDIDEKNPRTRMDAWDALDEYEHTKEDAWSAFIEQLSHIEGYVGK